MTSSVLRNITALTFLLSTFLGGAIYHIKHQVLDLEQRMQGLNRQIINTNETIHILKAEWGYLNQPKRLQGLNNKHLQLRSIAHYQVASYQTFPTLIASRQHKGPDRIIVARKKEGSIAT
jgi:hypothetical protein